MGGLCWVGFCELQKNSVVGGGEDGVDGGVVQAVDFLGEVLGFEENLWFVDGNVGLTGVTVAPNKNSFLVSLFRDQNMNKIVELLTDSIRFELDFDLNVFVRL